MKKTSIFTPNDFVRKLMTVCMVMLTIVGFCFLFSSGEALVIGELPDPTKTAETFFSSLKNGDYKTCDKYISGYSGLGLEKNPEDPGAKILFDALYDSFSYSIDDTKTVVKNTSAQVSVTVRYFSVGKATEDISRLSGQMLADVVGQYNDESQVYDENGQYQAAIYEEVSVRVAQKIVNDIDKYMIEKKLMINMTYSDGWLVEADDELLDVLCGDMLD